MFAVQEPVVSPVENPSVAGQRPAPRRRRREWRPKVREQALYLAVRVQGRTQASVAEDYRVSQSTVSRVLKRFDAWRRLCSDHPDDYATDAGRRAAFEMELCRQRFEEIYRLAMQLAERLAAGPVVTRRQGERNGKAWSETTERDMSVTASQCLKTALRASEALQRLDDSLDYELGDAWDRLEAERAKAESGGRRRDRGRGRGSDRRRDGETEGRRDGDNPTSLRRSFSQSLRPARSANLHKCA